MMTRLRLVFYALYVVLGAVMLVRVGSLGIRWETISGLVLAAAFICLGVYRLRLWSTHR